MFHSEFQSFDEAADRAATPARVEALRAQLAAGGLGGFVVPISDKHQNEYRPPSEERLAWLTGFTGSAGTVIVLSARAALFVDGRYTLQVRDQVDPELFELVNSGDVSPQAWIEANVPPGTKLGYDPWLLTPERVEQFDKACRKAGASLVAVASNPIDAIWLDRAAEPLGAVVIHDLRFAGETTASKLTRIRAEIAKSRSDRLLVSDPRSLAWTFNIRGSDVAHTPLPLGFAVIGREGRPCLYLDGRKLSNAVRAALEEVAELREPGRLTADLADWARDGEAIRVDAHSAAAALATIIKEAGGRVESDPDPITPMKAIKNDAEIAGARAAHSRDGAAICRFLAWFDGEAPRGSLSEIDAVEALETFRRETGALREVSFPTISGSGPNGAIVHYRVTRATNRTLSQGELFLLDSGAQYEDGTTDITRTIAVGQPTAEMRDRFTRVLKGHIAIATAIFPEGATGAQIDPLARYPLWRAGLDFDHGTGHGVGSYLSVHEGPASISKAGTVALRRGMILSNEPGYYKTGAYGIRIENLVLVTPAPQPPGAEKELNCFDTLTLAPIDRRLIEPGLLSRDERAWIDDYHRRVFEVLSPLVDPATSAWLGQATRPLGAAPDG